MLLSPKYSTVCNIIHCEPEDRPPPKSTVGESVIHAISQAVRIWYKTSLRAYWSLAVKLEKPKLLAPLPQVDGLWIYIPIPGLPLAKVLSVTWPFTTPLM
jgi:hypothetical protein